MTRIILASSSEYRKKLLQSLISSFECISPDIDESLQMNESAQEYVSRLALEKAQTVANSIEANSPTLIIGSDQCAVLNNEIITKPHTHEAAVKQLKASSGNTVVFYTGVCIVNFKSKSHQTICETFQVTFRKLTDRQINSYLKKDKPYDCAGSFKAEGLGITLFEKMQGDDPSALIGLPLIKLTSMLQTEGYDPITFK